VRPVPVCLHVFIAMLVFVVPAAANTDAADVSLVPGGGIIWGPDSGQKPGRTIGGILEFRVADPWAVEFRVHRTYRVAGGGSGFSITHGEGNLTWLLAPKARISPYLTAGAGIASDEFGWNGGPGLRLRIIDRVSLRIDGRNLSYRTHVEIAPGQVALRFRHATELFGGVSLSLGRSRAAPRGK